MGELQELLIQKAIQKHKKIFPCTRKESFDACFTKEKDRLLFWYNTKDKSTHVVSAKIIRGRLAPVTRRKAAAAH